MSDTIRWQPRSWRRWPALALAVLLAACSAPAREAPPVPTRAPAAASAAAPQAAPAAAADVVPRPIPATPDKLKVAEVGFVSDASTYFALERGYFAEQGLDVELVRIDPQPLFTLVASGQMDMGMASVSTSFYNGLGRGLSVRIVAEAARGTPRHSSSGLVVRRELVDSGRLRDYPDLRGLTIALAGPGGLTTLYLGRALERGGLGFGDINLVTISYPDMHAAFANGAIDGAIQTEPLASVGQRQGITRKWKTSGELTGELPSIVLMYGPTIVESKRAAGERFMVAYGRGVRDYYDAFITGRTDKAAAVEIVTRHSAVKDPALYDIMDFATVNPDLRVDVAGITGEQEWFWSQGMLPELRAPVDVAAATDNSFVDYALKVLGPYR